MSEKKEKYQGLPTYDQLSPPYVVGTVYKEGTRHCRIAYENIAKEAEIPLKGQKKNWISVENFLPKPFDLVEVLTEDFEKKRGWYTGFLKTWDGYKLMEDEKVTYWRRHGD